MKRNNHAATGIVGTVAGLLAILITVLIAVMIYFNIAGVGDLALQVERFTPAANTYSTSLSYGAAEVSSVTYYDANTSTWNTSSVGTTARGQYTVSGSTFTVTLSHNVTSVNVSYYSDTGVVMKDSVNPASVTVFTLAPIIAIVMVAGVVLFIVMGFGRNEI